MRPRSFVAALIVATAGCRGPAAPPPPSHVTPPPATAIPLPKPVAGSRALLVEPPYGLGLFRDEAIDAERRIAAWARRQRYQVVPVDHAESILAKALVGQSLDGRACGLPLSRWYARERYAADLGASGQLKTDVRCQRPEGAGADEPLSCTLHVAVLSSVDLDGKTVARYRAPFDAQQPWPAALDQALGALTREDAKSGSGGLGLLGALAGARTVTAQPERLAWSAWPARLTGGLPDDSLRSALSFPGGDAPLRACFAQSGGEELLVAVDASGRVTRCESRNAEDEGARCACAAFKTQARGAQAIAGRRAFVGVSFEKGDVVTPTDLVVTASLITHIEPDAGPEGVERFRPAVSDRSIDGWQPPDGSALEPCFAQRREPADQELTFLVVFDGYGRATEVDLDDKSSDPLSPEELACVQQGLMASRAPCPASPQTSARVQLRLHLRRIGSKIPGVGEVLEKALEPAEPPPPEGAEP